jgi:phospholipase/carboxylesterase
LEISTLSAYIKESVGDPQACIIWMHGLGADYRDMAGLVEELDFLPTTRHIFLDAPIRPVTINNHMSMRAWYDLRGLDFSINEDREGILASEQSIRQIMTEQISLGLLPEQIFLAGFSQGGAMALFTGLRCKGRIGGIIALSSGIPLRSECTLSMDKNTPIFFACGQYDPIVLPIWSRQSREWLEVNNYRHITWCEYPMQHSICQQEIADLNDWLNLKISLLQDKETRS